VIYVVLVIAYLLLGISFMTKNKTLGMLSSFAIMTVGVYILINGISYIDALLIEAIATISIGFGFYMLMQACLEIIDESGI
jgi:hypothetical protein